ncbi:AAA family ATPase [Alicyclobacillus fodiniaquatilis]|uniref:AAA family ATPase n=1 Tax=Alicyclobacillus fodiniaquatilis TaxID=1661150 RepID=A0ABW4JPS4_9BACL
MFKKHAKLFAPSFGFNADELNGRLAAGQYYLDMFNCRRLVHYLALGKPVGLRGEPGIGKSELPERMAALLGAQLIDIECHSQLEASDIGVSWNAYRQIVDAQTKQMKGEPFSLPYLNKTPLLSCLLAEAPVVLRIDEIDKLNETTSNFFLRFLDKQELVIHDLAEEANVLRAKTDIYVFLTSNDYRLLDPALMRRIAWMELSFPDEQRLAQIITAKTPASTDVARRIAYVVMRLRQLELRKKPSIGEVLDWTRALCQASDGALTLDAIHVTLGLLLKYADDEKKGWEAIQSWVDQQTQDFARTRKP